MTEFHIRNKKKKTVLTEKIVDKS